MLNVDNEHRNYFTSPCSRVLRACPSACSSLLRGRSSDILEGCAAEERASSSDDLLFARTDLHSGSIQVPCTTIEDPSLIRSTRFQRKARSSPSAHHVDRLRKFACRPRGGTLQQLGLVRVHDFFVPSPSDLPSLCRTGGRGTARQAAMAGRLIMNDAARRSDTETSAGPRRTPRAAINVTVRKHVSPGASVEHLLAF